MDTHLASTTMVELCLIELDDGSVIAQRDVPVSQYLMPRSIGDSLYLCDSQGGVIYKLDKNLQTVQEWNVEPVEGNFYMSQKETAYLYNYEESLTRYDLTTGETTPALAGDPDICWINEGTDSLIIKYYTPDNGAPAYAVLDLLTDTCRYAEPEDQVDSASRMGSTWIYEKYLENYIYYLHTDGEDPLRLEAQQSTVTMLPQGYLMETTLDGTNLRLYQMDGTLISACTVLENGDGYLSTKMIWNEANGGYFFLLQSYDEVTRLIFWDISKSAGGENLALEPVPETDAIQTGLEERAGELEQKYGVSILVGDECDTTFDEFSATQVADWDRVMVALDTLDMALAVYPDGFIRQLRFGNVKGIQIHLICDLQAHGSGRTGGGYNAFAQEHFDHYLMVMDIDVCDTDTYYHEMSHIIDAYLLWDSLNREDALYSEAGWGNLNPDWFKGYTYDYSMEQQILRDGWFVDGYSTIRPTEDRARVMEYAMVPYGRWMFEDAPGLQQKLDYYCRCIRDAFDTTGWPETVLWEQYLAK